MHLQGADSNINAFYVCRGNCWKNPSRSPCLLAGQGGFLEQEGAVLGSMLHPCACRCCLPWAEVLCSPVSPRGWHCSTGDTAGDSATPHSQAVLCHTSHHGQPCMCHTGVKGASVTSSFLHGRATDHMEESQVWGRICCRFLHPFFIPVACHPAVPFLGWQPPVSTLRVSLQSPSSPSVFLVLLW